MMMLRPLNAARRALRTPPFALGLHRQASAAALPHVLRNVGIIAHIDAGKTTTTERMLLVSGAVTREGRVDQGNTTTDFLVQERERGITIQSAAVNFNWRDHTVCLIDTPGHVDFTLEVERSLRVLDGAVLVVDAVAGVQAQTETVWRQATRYGVPAIAFINKMDRDGADFSAACGSVANRLGAKPLPIQMPILVDERPIGSVDLVGMTAHFWGLNHSSSDGDAAGAAEGERVVPVAEAESQVAGIVQSAKAARMALIESLADYDDVIAEHYFNILEEEGDGEEGGNGGASVEPAELVAALRRVVCSRIPNHPDYRSILAADGEEEGFDEGNNEEVVVVPCLMGASLRGLGVEALLDSIVALLPAPTDRPAPKLLPFAGSSSSDGKSTSSTSNTKGGGKGGKGISGPVTLATGPKDPLCALAFKVSHDVHRGALVYARIYGGSLEKGQLLRTGSAADASHKERCLAVLRPLGDDLQPIEEEEGGAKPGETVVIVGLKQARTGDTLVVHKGPLHNFALPGVPIPAPVFSAAVIPAEPSKAKAVGEALHVMARDDPSLLVGPDPEDPDTMVMAGMGELHLDVACSRLLSDHRLKASLGRARLAYRETVWPHAFPLQCLQNFTYERTLGGGDDGKPAKRLFAGFDIEITAARADPSETSSSSAAADSAAASEGRFTMAPATVHLSPKATKALGTVDYAEGLRKGLLEAVNAGPLHGFAMSGMHFEVTDCTVDADSSPAVLRLAALAAIRRLGKLAKDDLTLLHPVMALEVVVPEPSLGSVLTDLTVARQASVKSVASRGAGLAQRHVIVADAPLSNLLGYATSLRSLTAGEGLFTMEYAHHAPLDALPPEDVPKRQRNEGQGGTAAATLEP